MTAVGLMTVMPQQQQQHLELNTKLDFLVTLSGPLADTQASLMGTYRRFLALKKPRSVSHVPWLLV